MENLNLSNFHWIGKSRIIQELEEQVCITAPHWDTVLITGERGSGKELLARAIHNFGPAKRGNLVVVDCASLHGATLESALFGHEKGAFTGAYCKHIGLLESANGGSVFLDEVSSLPLSAQTRFLRFLEEKTMTRVGGKDSLQIHTRVIAASNRNMIQDVENGLFLPDLYDRLNILRIHVPPLREREGDVFLLFDYFMGKAQSYRLTDDAKRFLLSYQFPGNIRELKNLCRRLAVYYPEGKIGECDIKKVLTGETNCLYRNNPQPVYTAIDETNKVNSIV